MNETPSIEERYIVARNGSDVIGAAGVAARLSDERNRVQLALLLWGVTYQGKTERKKELAEALGDYLNARMARNRRLKGDAWKIAKEMLGWHLHGVCLPCEGRGYEVIQGTPSLSDKLCHHCHGTGKRPYPREAAHAWMAAEFASLTAIASAEVMKHLNTRMEL